MGDRSNLFFRAGKSGLGVYGHWAGVGMADAAMAVLKNKAFQSRLGDVNYAMRIGVQVALDAIGADVKSETGVGLWLPESPDDNEYPYLVIDLNDGAVFVCKNWKKPRPSERVEKPTAAKLRKLMDAGAERDDD